MTNDSEDVATDVPEAPDEGSATRDKSKGRGLRGYVRSLEDQRNELSGRVSELEADLAGARLDVVLAEMRVPEAFRAVARQRGTDPSRDAVEALMSQVRAEAESASRVLAEYDAEPQNDELPEVDGYTPAQVQAAVAAAVSVALAARNLADEGGDHD